jgi:protein associated with RNAse G/E
MNRSELYVNYRKWPDSAHWHFTVNSLGSDTHGAWFCLPDGALIQRGTEVPIISRMSVMLLPKDAWWVASWNTDKTKPHELYIDIVKRVRSDANEVTMIDLDLDVVRTWDGHVEMLDRDEFELHKQTFHYPRELVEKAESTAELLANSVANGQEPFGVVGEAWRARAIAQS